MDNYKKIKDALNRLSDLYKQNENDFFNERDIHHLFFSMIYSDFKPLVHPEYRTNKRFIREKSKKEKYQEDKHSFVPEIKKGRRGHYDVVVLSNEFYQRNKKNFDKLSNKTIGINSNEKKYIDIALEFKYFIDRIDLEEISFDIFKLREGDEIKHKILVIFLKKGVDLTDTMEKNIKDFAGNDVEVCFILPND